MPKVREACRLLTRSTHFGNCSPLTEMRGTSAVLVVAVSK